MNQKDSTKPLVLARERARANPDLDANALLIAEFEYIAQTAFQATEDRSRATTLYLVTTGSLIAAILSTQVEQLQVAETYWSFAILFCGLSFFSLLTLLQLARLRLAWLSSVAAMNHIKQFYIEHSQLPDLESAFLWNARTLPSPSKPWSVASLLMLQVALLGSLAAGAAIIFFGLANQLQAWWWGGASVVGACFFIIQIGLYYALLRRSAENKGTNEQMNKTENKEPNGEQRT
ncbi:MAG TPA: hypothetical protein VGD58_33065 [Herpetosiphonaceae bacterium]